MVYTYKPNTQEVEAEIRNWRPDRKGYIMCTYLKKKKKTYMQQKTDHTKVPVQKILP